MEFERKMKALYEKIKEEPIKGEQPDYIPALQAVSPHKLGVHLQYVDGMSYGIGDDQEIFSLQSLVKVLTLALAYNKMGEDLWKRCGYEPSGTAFHSLSQLEQDEGIPRNPFINSGALVICDLLVKILPRPKEDFLAFIHELSGDESLTYDDKVAASEKSVGYRNKALCYFIKSFQNIESDPEDVLDFYFYICSLRGNCRQLTQLFFFLAHSGKNRAEQRILSVSQAKRINAIMATCGFYDESGQFAFKVGLPGKSGVGGGIVAVKPFDYVVSVWSPPLNKKGNSLKGCQFLEALTSEINPSIF